MSSSETVRAGVLVIGDEILSGRTRDQNIGYIAEYLTNLGIEVAEARVVPDDEARIIAALDEMRAAYDYVLTTGGIGPTHDDITADCVAKAFGVDISENDEALAMLASRFPSRELTEARRRMARIPHGARLVENPVSMAPGFEIGNVFVMAGVPAIMQAMLDNVAGRLRTGVRLHVVTIETRIREGEVAGPLRAVHAAHPEVAIGSYPYYSDTGFGANVVCRGKDPARVEAAGQAVIDALSALGEVRLARPGAT
jgi:molybdenum cofactor synthesis domain-containing protein